MKCPACDHETHRVISTRPLEDGVFTRRRLECLRCGERLTTYEVPEGAFRSAGADIRKWQRGQGHRTFIRDRAAVRERMRADRLAGMSCPDIASKYSMSVDMARYYTRMPRAKLYPAAKARAEQQGTAK